MTTPVFPSFTPLKWVDCKGGGGYKLHWFFFWHDVLIQVFVC